MKKNLFVNPLGLVKKLVCFFPFIKKSKPLAEIIFRYNTFFLFTFWTPHTLFTLSICDFVYFIPGGGGHPGPPLCFRGLILSTYSALFVYIYFLLFLYSIKKPHNRVVVPHTFFESSGPDLHTRIRITGSRSESRLPMKL